MKIKVRRSRLRALLLAAIGAMALSAFGAGSASADTVHTYCTGFGATSYATCKGPRHSISRNEVDGDSYAAYCAGAFLDGSFYGSYICNSGGPHAAHNYSGANLLQPAAHSSYQGYQVLNGWNWW